MGWSDMFNLRDSIKWEGIEKRDWLGLAEEEEFFPLSCVSTCLTIIVIKLRQWHQIPPPALTCSHDFVLGRSSQTTHLSSQPSNLSKLATHCPQHWNKRGNSSICIFSLKQPAQLKWFFSWRTTELLKGWDYLKVTFGVWSWNQR